VKVAEVSMADTQDTDIVYAVLTIFSWKKELGQGIEVGQVSTT
jgi:hypothetical protein